jgi:Glycosyl hydrolase family 65, N-terminal domain
MMIHHVPLRPPFRDFPADEWNVIEKGFHPEFLAQLETMLALGNGYLGMRGCPEEGAPNKRRARRNALTDIMSKVPYEEIRQPKVELPKRQDRGDYRKPIIRSG